MTKPLTSATKPPPAKPMPAAMEYILILTAATYRHGIEQIKQIIRSNPQAEFTILDYGLRHWQQNNLMTYGATLVPLGTPRAAQLVMAYRIGVQHGRTRLPERLQLPAVTGGRR